MEIAPPDQAGQGLPSILGRPVFSVDGEEHRWEDVLLAAHAWGEWAKLDSRAAEGVACARRAEVEGDPLAEDEVGSTAKAFRYARDLLSADEMEAWLERWGLDLDRWMASIRRSLLLEHWSAELEETTSRFAAPADEVRDAVWVDAICSGALAAFARALAARAAAYSALDGSGAPDPTDVPGADAVAGLGLPLARSRESLSRTARLDGSFRRFCERAVTAEALEHVVGMREMDWLLVKCRSLALRDEGMAREAALCVRADGMPLAEVAAQAGRAVDDVRVYLEDMEPPLKDMLVSAGEGELLGPVSAGERFLLVAVEAKTRPSVEDPAIRERAEREVVKRAVEQEVINRVRWHERV